VILRIDYKADWVRIMQRRQEQIARDNARENARCLPYVYKIGDKVQLLKPGIRQ
jgi:hypothetical protein